MSDSRKTKGKYDEQFRKDAVEYYYRTGKTIAAAANDLGVVHQTLGKWITKAEKEGQVNEAQKSEHQELQRLRKELAEVTMERDILKKAMAVFAKQK